MYIPRRKVDTAMRSSTLAKERVHTPTRINISLDIYVARRYATYTYIYAVVCMYYKMYTYASLRRTRFEVRRFPYLRLAISDNKICLSRAQVDDVRPECG